MDLGSGHTPVSGAGQDGSGQGIFAQRFQANGTRLGGEFQVNTTTVNDQTHPSVAADGNGDFVVSWQSFGQADPSSTDVYARVFGPSGQPATSEILVNLTILIYFVPYLYLFAALVRLRPAGPAQSIEIRIPGGTPGLWVVAAVGFAATAVALALTFMPPPGSNALTFEVSLVVQAVVMIGIGLMFYVVRGRKRI